MLTNGNIPSGMVIDHINGNRLDNRLINLRLLNVKNNCQNIIQRRFKHNLPAGVGINWNRFQAKIMIDGKRRVVGQYDTAYEAGLAYIQAKLKYHPHAGVSRLIAELAEWASQHK